MPEVRLTLRIYIGQTYRVLFLWTDEYGRFTFTNLPTGCDLWLQINGKNSAGWFGNNGWAFFPEDWRYMNLTQNINNANISVSSDQGYILHRLYYGRKFCGQYFGWQRQSVKVFHSFTGGYAEFRPILDEIHISQAAVWYKKGEAICHEYGHAVMHDKYGWYDYSRKFIDYISEHDLRVVTNKPTAICEGWAEFFGYTIVHQFGTLYSYIVEDFYPDDGEPPYYKGEWPYTNTDGTVVEGAVMQVLWDIYDGIGDEGLGSWSWYIWCVISEYEPNSIDGFLDGWIEQAFPGLPGLDEMTNCNLNGTKPLAPSGLYARDTTHNSIQLRWTDNALNEGQYFVYRQISSGNWERLPTILGPNTTTFTNTGLNFCTQYSYKVRALTCDTSNYSNEISIRTKYLPDSNLQARHCQDRVELSWTNPQTNTGFLRTIIVRKQGLGGIAWNPTDGLNYNVEQTVGDAIVVYNSNGNSFIDNIPNAGEPYHYKAFAYNNQYYYSLGTQTLAILPFSDVSPLTGTNNTNKIVSRGNNVHMVFVGRMNPDDWDDRIIYRYSSDGGNTWAAPEYIAYFYESSPIYPTISLDSEGRPHILWAGWVQFNNNMYLVCRHTYKNGNDWISFQPVLIKSYNNYSAPLFSLPSIPFSIRGDSGFCAIIIPYVMPNQITLEVFKFYLYEQVNAPHYRHKSVLFTDASNVSPNEDWYPNRPSLTIDGDRVVVCYNKRVNNVDSLTIRWGGASNNVIMPYSYAYNPHILAERQNTLLLAWYDDYGLSIKFTRCMWENNSYTLTNPQQVYYDDLLPFCLPLPSPRIVNSGLVVFHGTLEPYSKIFIFYSQRSGNNWLTTNIFNPAVEQGDHVYPQAFVAPNNIHLSQTLQIYWSKKTGARYYLMNKSVNLPNYYVACDMATGPNNGTHLMRVPNSKEMYMVFQEQNRIYLLHSFDEGENWETEEIGEGLYPCLGLNYSGLPWIAYVKDGDLICKIRREDDSWKEILIYDGNENLWAGPPSMQLATGIENKSEYAYITYPVYEGTMSESPCPQPPQNNHSYIYVSLFDTTGVNKVTHLLDEGDADLPLSHPCVGVTPADLIHIVWQQGSEIWYITNTGEITPENWQDVQWTPKYDLSNTGEVPSEHPFVESYGDIVYVVWKEGNPGEIIRKERYVWKPSEYEKWSDAVNLSNSPDVNSDYPQMSAGDVVAWQESDADGKHYKVYTNIQGKILNLTPDANNVSYVHTNALVLDPKAPEIMVYYCYTDEITEGELYEVKFDKYLFPEGIAGEVVEVKYYEGKTGEEVASPYCELRTGYIDYGDWTIDYGNQLEYKLKYLDPCKHYQFQAIVYQDTTGTIRQKLEIEDTLEATMRVYPAEPETINIFISPNSYKEDLESALEIIKTRGPFATIAEFKVYEYEVISDSGGSGSGLQSAGLKQLPIPTMLHAPKPNPFTNLTQIRFQIPIKTKVELKVYNSAGRLVNALVDDEMNPGYYTMNWTGKDNQERICANGIYFIRLKTKDYKATKKMVMIK